MASCSERGNEAVSSIRGEESPGHLTESILKKKKLSLLPSLKTHRLGGSVNYSHRFLT
jgi:hypothetical protein